MTRASPLTEKDGVLLADFVNKTGDPVFDDALKQALSIQLSQSPFLNIVSDRKIEETLRLMGQPIQHITPELAREICIRTGSKATVLGSISNLGTQYVIGLNAVGCANGDNLAAEQMEAAGKEDVLKALGQAATGLRGKLGESLVTVEKFDVPVEATTPSLEALKAYSMGGRTRRRKGDAEAIPFFKRAIELDPTFALAYAALSVSYFNLNQAGLATENATKAYELRDRVSDRERYRISTIYYHAVTGDLQKSMEVYELWSKSYPRDDTPPLNLGVVYQQLGEYDKAEDDFASARTVLKTTGNVPWLAVVDLNHAAMQMSRDRFHEAVAELRDSADRLAQFGLARHQLLADGRLVISHLALQDFAAAAADDAAAAALQRVAMLQQAYRQRIAQAGAQEDKERIAAEADTALTNAVSDQGLTVEEYVSPAGERYQVRVLKTPLIDADGEISGVQGIFWDVTEQRRSERRRAGSST